MSHQWGKYRAMGVVPLQGETKWSVFIFDEEHKEWTHVPGAPWVRTQHEAEEMVLDFRKEEIIK